MKVSDAPEGTNPVRAKNVGRVLSAVGVIASLLFVGLEIRQNTRATRAETRQGLADRNAIVINSIAENPELARAWSIRWLPNPPDTAQLSRTDSTQTQYAMLGMIRHMENVYLQVLERTVDESVLDSYGFRNNDVVFGTPQFREWWARMSQILDPRFVAAFEAEYSLR